MTNNEPDTQAMPFMRVFKVLAVVAILLVATGCAIDEAGNLQRIPPRALRPIPPLQPALFADLEPRAVSKPIAPLRPTVFADFDGRAYVPDRIVIPSIELDSPVVDIGWSTTADSSGSVVKNWDVAEYAAGWHVNSDRLGQGGNVVLSGHNNMLGAVFREMDRLEVGDVATLWSGGIRYDYEIEAVHIVAEQGAPVEQRRKNARWIGEFDDDRLTLVTCWPRGGNSHRIIAVGHLVGGETGFETMVATSQ